MKPKYQQPSNVRDTALLVGHGHRVQGPVVARCRSLVLNHPPARAGEESGVWELARRAGRMLDAVGLRLLHRNTESPGVGERTPESRDTKTPPDVRSVASRRVRVSGRRVAQTRVSPRGASGPGTSDEERLRFKAG